MSVSIEGSEEMFTQILTYIEESLENLKDEIQDVVMIDLSAYDLDNDSVLEMIHVKYNAEIIGKRMFIKYDGKLKQRIHRRLAHSAETHNPNWDVDETGTCTTRNRDTFLPDVGIWFQLVTKAQRVTPIKARCPLPNVWIGVFFNRDPDRSHALSNIDLIQRQNLGIEFVCIALPFSTANFPQNPNPGAATVQATPTANQNSRPTRAPYIIHWNANNVPVYYKMSWNNHIILRCGWALDFNLVLNVLAM
ncbi:hypothetical protein GLOIN_2v1677127 [Rhizophagus irregularis DAOM 181602=DAOM 197198]|nr:hypothetical protein GLOIN_2v1677127 [Rhizophagus irregularis DAOM 181602=DAOM 197198]CAG8746355.1 13194_t:CDS:2 [Rhizophagus irregularis]